MAPSEILFRAKHLRDEFYLGKIIPKGKWLKGWYFLNQRKQETEHCLIMPYMNGEKGRAELVIDPDTLCQFTGLRDVNKKPIYQGDIIKDEVGEIYEVCWYDDLAAFIAEIVCNKKPFMMMDIDPDKCEIIGNVFDNPELLKQQS